MLCMKCDILRLHIILKFIFFNLIEQKFFHNIINRIIDLLMRIKQERVTAKPF